MAKLLYQYELIKLNGLLREPLLDNAPLFLGLAVVWIAISYFLGGLNFAIIFSKLFYHDDIRKYGSGNAGFTNMKRTFGKKAAIAVIVCDFLKTVLAVGIGALLFGADIATLAGVGCILGHCFPCLYGFKGGKGVAAAGAMVLVLDPIEFVILISLFLLIVWGTKYLSMGSIMTLVLYPIIHNRIYNYIHASLLPNYFIKNGLYTSVPTLNGAVTDVADFTNTLVHTTTPVMVIVGIFLATFVVIMHRTNIRRILDGKENRFYFGKKAPEQATKSDPHRFDRLDDELNGKN